MAFRSVNEIDQFSFRDCIIRKFDIGDDVILGLEALIVLPNNSQNTNFTKSYAGPVTMRLKGGVIRSAVKEGYKYRDVNGRILEEIPDRTLTKEEIAELPKLCEGQYLYDMQKLAEDNGIQTWVLGIECPQQEEFDTLVTDSWQIAVSFTEAVLDAVSPQGLITEAMSSAGADATDLMSGYFANNSFEVRLTLLSVHCADNIPLMASLSGRS